MQVMKRAAVRRGEESLFFDCMCLQNVNVLLAKRNRPVFSSAMTHTSANLKACLDEESQGIFCLSDQI